MFKIKINGMRKKVRFLENNEVICENDLYVNKLPNDATKNYIMSQHKLSDFSITAAAGDTINQHPQRTYLRVLN